MTKNKFFLDMQTGIKTLQLQNLTRNWAQIEVGYRLRKLAQNTCAVLASILVSSSLTPENAKANNVRVEDVDNPVMQSGIFEFLVMTALLLAL